MIDSRCGLHCTSCSYKVSHGCGGCIETNGHPFHGECPVAICCQERGIAHCGECPEIPCELLTQYSCDPEQGDTPHGARIEQCRRWAAPAGLCSFSGINLYSRKPERTLEFYKKLGFRVTEAGEPDNEYYGASLALSDCGNAPLLWIWRATGERSRAANLVFNAGDLHALHARITAAGIECPPPTTAAWGGMELLLIDPDGNALLFI